MAGITKEYLADALTFLLRKYRLWGGSYPRSCWFYVYFEQWNGDIPVALSNLYPGLYLERIFSKPHEEGVLLLRDIPKSGQIMQEISCTVSSRDDIDWAVLLYRHNIKRDE